MPQNSLMEEISKDLLDILACPKCKSSVVREENTIKCADDDCGLIYPIRDGIPIMLIEEANKG